MIIQFRYGFFYDDVPYGWREKELYRLPYKSKSNYYYPIKKLDQIMIGNKVGYRVSRDKKTIDQLEELTNVISYEYNNIVSPDTPFRRT